MKNIFLIAVCLCGLSFGGHAVSLPEQSLVVRSDNWGNFQNITDVIQYWTQTWYSQGYKVMTFQEFKTTNLVPDNIINRFEKELNFFANKRYEMYTHSFIIYKQEMTSSFTFYAFCLEDTPDNIMPVKFQQVDSYIWRW